MAQTLEELKAANAAAEAAANNDENVEVENEVEVSPQETEIENDTETAETELEETTEDAETEAEETGEEDVEDWMQGDGHESQEKKYTGSDIGAAKAKLKAKLEKKLDAKDEEIERLKAEIAAKQSGSKPDELVKPKREDFYEEEDPDEAYFEALADWKLKKHQAEQQASQAGETTAKQQQEAAEAINREVDRHYESAVKLAEKSGISPEAYQGADLRVRMTVEEIFPGIGDKITDGMIASLGEGSEKVFYNLGVNAQRREEFANKLREDSTGLKAIAYLGYLKGELTAPAKRRTNAPAPAVSADGDAAGDSKVRALKNKYDSAHKKGDMQAAFNLKREAKKAGVDTANW